MASCVARRTDGGQDLSDDWNWVKLSTQEEMAMTPTPQQETRGELTGGQNVAMRNGNRAERLSAQMFNLSYYILLFYFIFKKYIISI